ncbi:hypothetical protein HPB50_021114 [Hyalomma asiaticum]|uniref:Uncharacterized protein n=1 Tax=Hyalomma asiaticum TaxID=266040 RepID=A0ACB7TN45_HYAAI|nr:hypothetical protein HPB50_021114 [Hyalomma asiaticum]
MQVETQFAARSINADHTKFHHVVGSLPPAVASEVRDPLLDPPSTNAYKSLRELLVSRFAPREPQRLNKLLQSAEFGDRMSSIVAPHGTTTRHNGQQVDSGLLRELQSIQQTSAWLSRRVLTNSSLSSPNSPTC